MVGVLRGAAAAGVTTAVITVAPSTSTAASGEFGGTISSVMTPSLMPRRTA